MATKTKKKSQLNQEDTMRMRRLEEEVRGRLSEMALIVARNLDMHVDPSMQVMFCPTSHSMKGKGDASQKAAPEFKGTEIICTPSGCGCYDLDIGICYEC